MSNYFPEVITLKKPDSCIVDKQLFLDSYLDNHEVSENLFKELDEIFNSGKPCAGCEFKNITLAELIDHITSVHHQYSKEMFPIICSHIKTLSLKHGLRHPELIAIDVLFSHPTKTSFKNHLVIEETVLFHRIKIIEEIYNGLRTMPGIITIESIIKVMMADHIIALRILKEIRDLTNNFTLPDDTCSYYRIAFMELQAFELHGIKSIYLQDNILFPAALEMLKKIN